MTAAEDFTAEEIARGRALRRAQWPPLLAGWAVSTVLLLVLGLTPAGAALVTLVARPFGGAWWARVLGGGLVLTVGREALVLPFAARVRVVRERFGLVTQGWAGWFADRGRELLVGVPLVVGALFGVYATAAATDRWWLWAAGAAALAVAVLSWLGPIVFEPLFNRFSPMGRGTLRDALLALADRDRIVVSDVLVADASRRTTALNAYVSGFGSTRRVVVYDTLLETAPEREIELVTAHEFGHVKHRDVAVGTALGALATAVGVAAVAALAGWRPLLDLAAVPRLADPRSIPLLAALAGVLSVLSGPLSCALSRRAERRADLHALRLTGDPAGFVAMQRRLTTANVADPDPPRLAHVLVGTHPTAVQRIASARAFQEAGGTP